MVVNFREHVGQQAGGVCQPRNGAKEAPPPAFFRPVPGLRRDRRSPSADALGYYLAPYGLGSLKSSRRAKKRIPSSTKEHILTVRDRSVRRRNAQLLVPRAGGLYPGVDRGDVAHAVAPQPLFEGFEPLPGVDRNAVFPGGAPADYSAVVGTRLAGNRQRFDELGIAHAGGEIDEWFGGHGRGFAEVRAGFLPRIRLLPAINRAAFHELRIDRHFHFHDVHAELRTREHLHALLDDLRFLARKLEALLVAAFRIVAHYFEEERDLVGFALGADTLHEGMLHVVDGGVVERRVVDQDLDGVGAPIHQPLHRNVRQQVGQAARLGGVVAGKLVGQQQTGIGGARASGFQTKIGVQQNGASMRRQNAADRRLELAHHGRRDFVDIDAAHGGQGLLQVASLVHGHCGDDTALVGERFHALQFSGGQHHWGYYGTRRAGGRSIPRGAVPGRT